MEKSFALQLAFAAVALAVIVAMLGFMAFLVLRNKVRDEDCPIDFLMAKANSCAMFGPISDCYRFDFRPAIPAATGEGDRLIIP